MTENVTKTLETATIINFFILKRKLTDKKACIRSALTDANGFPLTSIVKVSSFSVVIRFPNQDFLVSSGEDSGVKCTSSEEAVTENGEEKLNRSYCYTNYFDL